MDSTGFYVNRTGFYAGFYTVSTGFYTVSTSAAPEGVTALGGGATARPGRSAPVGPGLCLYCVIACAATLKLTNLKLCVSFRPP